MGNCTGIPMYTLFFGQTHMIYGNLRDRWQHSSTVPTRFAGQDGDPAIWCMYNGYKQARRPGGQPHFRLGQIFACNMYLASLKRSYEGGPSISFGFRHRFTPVMHGIHSSYAWFIMFSSWSILVRFFVYPHRPYRPFSFAGECRSEQGETRTRRPADGGRSGGDMVQRFDVLIQCIT